MDSLSLITRLTEAFGPPGFEDDITAIAREYISPAYAMSRDPMMNFFMQKDNPGNRPVVMLDAHSDEVGFMVQSIKSNGLLAVVPLGGMATTALPAKKMAIRNLDGALVTGVFAAKPPHFGTSKEIPALDQLRIDVGASSREEVAQLGIVPGCPVVPKSSTEMNGDTLIGKALDDRLGCAAVLEVMNALANDDLPVHPVGVLSTQEEVGTRGAKVIPARVKPAVAICFEAAPSDDQYDDTPQTVLGNGPMLRLYDPGIIANPRLVQFAKDVATREGIPLQLAVRKGGGTNANSYHLLEQGIPSIVLSVPARHIHSHNGMARLSDYQNTVRLGIALVRALTPAAIATL